MHFASRGFPFARLAALCFLCPAVTAVSAAHAAWPIDPGTNLPVAAVPGEQSGPAITPDGAGGAIIVWEDFRNGAKSDIYAQRIDADGTPMWGDNGLAVCTASEFQSRPQVTSDGSGGAIFAWTDYRSGSGDIYVQRVSAAGQVMWTSSGWPICDDGEAQLGVNLTGDGAGGAIVVWEDFRADASGDLFAQRVSASGIPLWTFNGVEVTTAAGGQLGTQIVPNGSGGAIVVWRDLRVGWAGDIYAQGVASNGTMQWAANGVPVCSATGGQYDPKLLASESGGAVVVWSDERTGTADIYVQRISGGGSPLWAANGILVCGATSFQTFPVLASDGLGGAVIAWEDARSDTTVDIYAQHVSANGVIDWQSDGVPVCVEAGWKAQPAIVADHSAGAVITWQDQRSLNGPAGALSGVRTRDDWLAVRKGRRTSAQGEFVPGDDIYAQHLTAAGSRSWPGEGIAVSSASDLQLVPVLIHDGMGGAVITWYDMRNGNWDIYAQHVNNSGLLGGTVDVPRTILAPGVQLSTPVPNPARRTTNIRFALPQAMNAEVDIFDAAGRRVRTLHTGPLAAGQHSLPFDLRDAGGRTIQAGLYFVRLRTPIVQRSTRFVATP